MVNTQSLLLLGALASSVAAQGVVDGFWETCTRWQLGFENETLYRHFMVAECLDDDNKLRTSFISLNDCLSNQEGDLTAKQDGGFQPTCQTCTTRSSFLTCQCKPTWGGPRTTTINLNEVIENVDGILSCFGYLGVEIDSFDASPA